ncbi:ribosomal protein S3AE [Candidatus Methanoperedens nitroreducens]|uniref:Small ribosomal subunit protein eS1 n=1 Tax=Candidatus Methanoperedens nitratireducens TaxID=1392998 RepID=A0A062V1C1_9EURY|nr:30S ribosomal protein S3ae [Candidatus Methanoperedens nitroreducens]KCZ71182.1 ribosomal protein S3AE [Candidatus Methanoperedens nitroreducens]MDJ1421440.1 30S ribosomal protein S3ae [Candidatus Methanoperedens sp.]
MAVTKAEGWKAKQWYNLVAPDMFGKANIGETVADAPEKLIGRVVEVTLGELTNDLSKQNIKLLLKVDHVGGDSAYTRFTGHQLTQDYLRSLVKRQTSSVETNVSVKTKDDYTLKVKPSCFTIKRARANQIKEIRQIMNNVIASRAKELDMAQFIQEVITGKLSANIYHDVKQVYPLRRVEVRKTEVEAAPAAA